jgi:O-antigen/teichoic acid export membrane protein
VLRILIVLVVILWATPGLVAISSSHLIAALIGCGLSIFPLRRIYRSRSENYTPLNVASELLRFSWPLLFAGLLNRTNTYTETLILGALSSSEQVGYFTVSLKISLVLTIFFEAFNGIWAPYITEAHARGDKEVFAGQFKTVTYWVFAITLPVALWLFIEAPAVMTLFGPEYTSSATVLQILTVSQCGYVLGGMSALTLIMTGFSRLNLFDLIVTIILSLVLDFTLIPAYGANGAAVASAIAVIFLTVLRSVQVYILLRVHPYNTTYIKPILAGAAAYITSILINQRIDNLFYIWQLLLVGVTITLVYCSVMLIFRSGSIIRRRVY